MIFRQLFDLNSFTYTYLVACGKTNKAVLIDPVFEMVQRDLALIEELGLTLETVCETHCHADHVTAAWTLKQKTGCKIASAEVIGASNVDITLNEGDEIIVSILSIGNRSRECSVFASAPGLRMQDSGAQQKKRKRYLILSSLTGGITSIIAFIVGCLIYGLDSQPSTVLADSPRGPAF